LNYLATQSTLMITQDQLALFNRRDHTIFTLVFNYYYEHIYLYVCYKTNETDAEDITMQIFMDLYNAKTTFLSIDNIKGYLFWLAQNRCFDFWKRQQKQKALTRKLNNQMYDHEMNDAQLQDDMQAIDALITIIKDLPGKYGEVARLLYCDHLTYQEIADKLQISLNTVSKLRIYSTKEIRKRLDNN
jgi:RNA polymerase sigma factor (sigma-70 family)